jgi:ABC-type uncharacterized transport system ATPase subunit
VTHTQVRYSTSTTLRSSLADRVAVLNTGRLAFEGSVAEVMADADTLSRNLGIH